MKALDYERDFILDPALSLYVPFWKKDGFSFMSDDKHGHKVTRYGCRWTPQGHYFDGVDDYVDCGSGNSLAPRDAITVMAWVKPNSLNYYDVVVEKPYTAASNPYFDYALTVQTSPFVRFRIDITEVVSTSALQVKHWTHLVGTYDRSNVKVYFDGVEEGNEAKTSQINTSGEPLYIGKSKNYGGRLFGGYISNVVIYSRAFSPLEIRNHYEATKCKYQ